jgi:hypothetical protein
MSNPSTPDPYYSSKCALSSFLANYLVSILFHPLELLKTRQQSNSTLNKAMMGRTFITSYHSIKVSLMASKIYIVLKVLRDPSRECI